MRNDEGGKALTPWWDQVVDGYRARMGDSQRFRNNTDELLLR